LQEVLLKQLVQLVRVAEQGRQAAELIAYESFTQSVQIDVLVQVRQLAKWVEQRSHF
jgi:hypothetical protein